MDPTTNTNTDNSASRNYFSELNSVSVSAKVAKKNGLNYLSWASAWAELKKRHPRAQFAVHKRERDGCIYFDDGRTAWVEVSVSLPVPDGSPNQAWIEHREILPVMDFNYRAIPVTKLTSVDVNKAIQRALTKAIARHGLGLYLYEGEDLPEEPVPSLDSALAAIREASSYKAICDIYLEQKQARRDVSALEKACRARLAELNQSNNNINNSKGTDK